MLEDLRCVAFSLGINGLSCLFCLVVIEIPTKDNHSGIVLEKVCEYFCYNEKNKDQINVPDMDIPPELCLELLMAGDYLDA